MVKVLAALISTSAIAKGFCDSIKFHPDTFPFQSDWWFADGNFAWNNRTWLEKTIFSFVSDGWHCFDAVRIVSLLVIAALLIVEVKFKKDDVIPKQAKYDNNKLLAVIGLTILAYTYHGIIFTLTYWIL
ncbi:MAG: hypothetical protein M5U17_02010 [Ignavibacterium sp.]|nr:hypothetical protein [Ignavibacterium sp.]